MSVELCRWIGAATQTVARLRRAGLTAAEGQALMAILHEVRTSHPDVVVDHARAQVQRLREQCEEMRERMERAEAYAQELEARLRELEGVR